MKIDKNSTAKNKDNQAWEVGDFIYSADEGLYLVAKITALRGPSSYTVIDLDSGYSSDSYETIAELQHHTGDPDDRIITWTSKLGALVGIEHAW